MIFTAVLVPLLIISVNGQIDEEVCPKQEDIAPCTCDREGLSCLNAKSEEDIRRAFRAPSKQKAIRTFWLNGSPVSQIRKDTFNGYKVVSFNMEYNNLDTIESGAFNGSEKTLTTLSLDSNHLTTFHFSDLKYFPLLSLLSLRNNSIQEIPANAFEDFKSLSVLSFSLNSITRIGQNAFTGLNLKSLDLSLNDIEELHEGSMSGFNAESLALIYCGIKRIHKNAFTNSKFVQIDLRFNRLTYLDRDVFLPIIYSSMINNVPRMLIRTAGNEFSCRGCNEYRWLVERKYLLEKTFFDFRCRDRRRLSDLTLYSIGCN